MFVQDHQISMLIYYEHVRLLDISASHGWNHLEKSAKKCYYLRLAATIDALKGAALGFVTQTTKALNEFVIGILHFDSVSIVNSAHYILGALVDLFALPIIGIIGIVMPPIAFSLTAKASELAKNIISKQSERLYRTTSFNEVTGRLICPLRGVTDALSDAAQAISHAITKIVNYPVTDNVDLINDIVMPLFKGTIRSDSLNNEHCLAEACVKIIAGGAGIIFKHSRNFLDIYP